MSGENTNKVLGIHSFIFDRDNKELILTTTMYDNGDNENNVYLNQTLTLYSTYNSSSFNLYGAIITPDKLRQLANELESAINKVQK